MLKDCVSYEKRTACGRNLYEGASITPKANMATLRIFRHVCFPVERLLKLLSVRLYACKSSRTSKRSFIKFNSGEIAEKLLIPVSVEV
jgi:hypothetical protein